MKLLYNLKRSTLILSLIIIALISLLLFLLLQESTTTLSLPPGTVQVESNGAKGDGVNDDTAAIQRTIDKLSKNKTGTVYLSSSKEYVISSTLTLKEGVELKLGNNARLQVDGNFNAIELEKGASIKGGVIEIINSSFDSDVIRLNGENKYYGIWDSTEIKEVKIVNSVSNIQGTALSLYAGGPSHFISFINFQDISISGFGTGVKLLTEDPKNGEYSWINGNRFQNFSMEHCVNFIVLEGNVTIPHESSGNLFTDMQVQLDKSTETLLSIDGSDNRFDGVVWDVQTLSHSEPILYLTNQSYKNVIQFNLDSKYIYNEGEKNQLSSFK